MLRNHNDIIDQIAMKIYQEIDAKSNRCLVVGYFDLEKATSSFDAFAPLTYSG